MRIESGRMLNDYIQPNKKQYCIPVFQRDYAWTTEQCEKLFEDIVLAFKKDRLHFCGSFVYAPLPTKKHIDRYIMRNTGWSCRNCFPKIAWKAFSWIT